jgi:hypothetical protein
LRKIRKNRWYNDPTLSWLLANEPQADALGDLGTKNNELSVFYIDGTESSLDRVVAALAAACDKPTLIDFAIIKQEVLPEIEIAVNHTNGDLPDDIVNEWHHDLSELSASKLIALAKAIKTNAKIDRKPEKRVTVLVAEGLMNGRIDRSRIKWDKKHLDELDQIIASRTENDSSANTI